MQYVLGISPELRTTLEHGPSLPALNAEDGRGGVCGWVHCHEDVRTSCSVHMPSMGLVHGTASDQQQSNTRMSALLTS
jgi:hypothetical protein